MPVDHVVRTSYYEAATSTIRTRVYLQSYTPYTLQSWESQTPAAPRVWRQEGWRPGGRRGPRRAPTEASCEHSDRSVSARVPRLDRTVSDCGHRWL